MPSELSFEDEGFTIPVVDETQNNSDSNYKTPFILKKYVRTNPKFNSLLSSDMFVIEHKDDPKKRQIELIENFYDKRNTGLIVYMDFQQILHLSGNRYENKESFTSYMPSTWRQRREFYEDVYNGDGKKFLYDIAYFLDKEYSIKKRAAMNLEKKGVSSDTADTFGELMDEL